MGQTVTVFDGTDRDELLRLLSARRRVELVRFFADSGSDTYDLDELAAGLRTRIGGVGDHDLGELQVTLHHVDLPMFDAVGLVEYDHERHRIDVNDDAVDRVAAFVDQHSD